MEIELWVLSGIVSVLLTTLINDQFRNPNIWKNRDVLIGISLTVLAGPAGLIIEILDLFTDIKNM